LSFGNYHKEILSDEYEYENEEEREEEEEVLELLRLI
jgi:hypothetical protein